MKFPKTSCCPSKKISSSINTSTKDSVSGILEFRDTVLQVPTRAEFLQCHTNKTSCASEARICPGYSNLKRKIKPFVTYSISVQKCNKEAKISASEV